MVAGQVAGRDGAAYVQGLGGAGQQLLVGISREGGVEVDRVGQVQVALGVHRARGAHLGEVDVHPPGVRGGQPVGLGLLGVEPGDGLLDQPGQLREPDLVRHRARRGRPRTPPPPARGTWCGPRSGPASTPAGHRPAAGTSTARADTCPRRPARGSDARTRSTSPTRPRTPPPRTPPPPGHPSPPSGRAFSCHSSTGPTRDSPECIATHRAASFITSRAASSSAPSEPAQTPTPWRGRRLRWAGAGRGWRSSWDQLCHRPPTVHGADSPVSTGIPRP